MLAETAERPFSEPGWLFELKYDGFRLLAAQEEPRPPASGAGGRPLLAYRRGHEATDLYPEIARALASLPFASVVLDGELVVLDRDARPVFRRLQQRAQLARSSDIARAAVESPVTYYVFDLLAAEGYDLRPLPLRRRKELLRRILPRAGPLRYTDHVEERGEALFAEVEQLDLEGLVAKRATAPYQAGRSSHWLKIRTQRTADFVVVGFSAPRRSRTGFRALHLALYEDAGLVYAGRVGSGFDEAELQGLSAWLEARRRSEAACGGAVPEGREHVWVEPELVCEVRFKEWTGDGLLREPVFLRVRDDKAPEECRREAARPEHRPAPDRLRVRVPGPSEVRFSNLEKVFWPERGHTKGDLIEFYRRVSPWLLPYLEDRPVVLTRFPDGIAGKSFFQKDAPRFAPAWVRTERIWSEHAQREIDYVVCNSVETLLYLANLATIPLHVWSSRLRTLQRPDWCVLDLDPKQVPFRDVVRVALALRELCLEMELPCFVKTSGSTGLHVLVPLGGQLTHGESRTLAELLARVVCERLPEQATAIRPLAARRGRVYVDSLQNGHGRLLAAPYSVRPLAAAPVSTPLCWNEVVPDLDPRRFTIETLPGRLAEQEADPLRGVLTEKSDLAQAVARLAERLRKPHST
jgi:bifunctional non-homologous end joining protein LigD